MQTDTLDIHPTATWIGGNQQHGTNVSTGTLLEYKGDCWYFSALWVSGDVTLRSKNDPKVFKSLNKEDAQGLKILN